MDLACLWWSDSWELMMKTCRSEAVLQDAGVCGKAEQRKKFPEVICAPTLREPQTVSQNISLQRFWHQSNVSI